ncbi:unnamed protein product [Closterium sp. Naga37s-1]|nr:unnamed protein product [Closterium sp. Naga37s-1]
MDLAFVGAEGLNNNGPNGGVNTSLSISLDDEIFDVKIMIGRLGLGANAMPAVEFVAVDNDQPTYAEPGPDPLAIEPAIAYSRASWEPPTTMQEVYDDENPETREARRTARAACEMLIGYARATCITPHDLCALFDHHRSDGACEPPLNLNTPPPPAMRADAAVPATNAEASTPRHRGRVLPAWMTAPPRSRHELIDSGVGAVMGGYVDAAEWMTARLKFEDVEVEACDCTPIFSSSSSCGEAIAIFPAGLVPILGDGASGSSNGSGNNSSSSGPGVSQALCELKPAAPTSNVSQQAQQSPRQLSLSFFARASLCAEGEGGAEGEAERLLKVLLLAVPLNASAAAAAGGGAEGGGAGEQVWGEWRVGVPLLPCGTGVCTKAPAPWDSSILVPSCKCPFNLPSFQPSHLAGLPSCFLDSFTCRQLPRNPCAPGVCMDDIDGTYSCLCPSPFFPFFYSKRTTRCYQCA